MHKDLEFLREIQTLDQRLKELDSEIASLPRRIATLETALVTHRQTVERIKSEQITLAAERRKTELSVQDFRAKVSKSRGHSSEVKTNQEYRAVMDEVAFAEAEISKCEERLLQLMENGEAQDGALARAQEALAAEQAQVDAARASLEARTTADRAERDRVNATREALRVQVGSDVLRRYERVSKLRGQGLAPIDLEACGSCRVRLRPQMLQEILARPHEIFVCESCGRLLFLPPQSSEANLTVDAQTARS
ncbi:MAG: zinc ribbon domain-containing protein [Terriglobales bacterium]